MDGKTVRKCFKDLKKEYNFGYENLTEKQVELLVHLLNGEDTISVLSTGHGKSDIFVVFILIKEKLEQSQPVCIVLSPLLSLAKDMEENIKRKGISCCFLSGQKPKTPEEIDKHHVMVKGWPVYILCVYCRLLSPTHSC